MELSLVTDVQSTVFSLDFGDLILCQFKRSQLFSVEALMIGSREWHVQFGVPSVESLGKSNLVL